MSAKRAGPLRGVRVLDLSTMIAGASAGAWMADFGADVIKIELPEGDPARALTKTDSDPRWWSVLNRNKRVIGVRLSDPDGAAICRRLVANGADVVIEGFRPGVLERWGLSYEQLAEVSPSLILTRLTGYGQDGPYAARPAYGTLLEAFTGFALTMGEESSPPVLPPYGLGDHIAGLFAAYGTCLAIHEREASGRGQVVDVSIYEALAMFMAPVLASVAASESPPPRTGNRSMSAAPRNTYRAADGWVAISVATDGLFGALANAMGQSELATDPRFESNAARVQHIAELDQVIEAWTSEHSRSDIIDMLSALGAPVGAVHDALEFVHDPHVAERGSLTSLPGAGDQGTVVPRVTPRLTRTPGQHWTGGRALGADTDDVLIDELGMSPADLDHLRAREIVR